MKLHYGNGDHKDTKSTKNGPIVSVSYLCAFLCVLCAFVVSVRFLEPVR